MVAGQQAVAAVTTRPRAMLLRASLLLLAVAAVSKLTTLAADSFVAARFGLSVDADAYLMAIGLIGALLAAPSEMVRLSVVPICGRYLREGDRRSAAGVVALVLLAVVVVGGVAALALVVSMPWIARLAAPGFDSEGLRKLVELMRVLAITAVLGLVMALLLGVLHTQLRFGVPAVVGIGLSVGVIGGGVLLGGRLGVTSLALGYVVGTAGATVVLAWLARGLFREGAALRAARREAGPFLRLALPTGFALFIISAGAVGERAVASLTGAGNVAALGFAIKLIMQAGVISQSIWTPLTPLLTASGASSEEGGDSRLLAFSLKLILLVLVPATALMIALREPLVSVIFERGAFTTADTSKTATLLALHSGSLVGEGLFMVAVAALLSFYDSGTRLVASGLFILSKVVLMLALTPVLGVAGIALAASVSSLLAGGYAVRVLGRRFPPGEMRALLVLGGKVLLAGLFMMAAAAFLSRLVAILAGNESLAVGVLQLAVAGLGATAVYLATLVFLNVEEAQILLRRLRERLAGAWG